MTGTDATTFDVCVVGSSNLDLVVSALRHPRPGETILGTEYHEYPGGKGLNQVVAARLGGNVCTFVSAIGDDDAGVHLAAVVDAEGIDQAPCNGWSGRRPAER